jgi:hypothetical protein
MKTNKLAELTIAFRNHLANEFGIADYWDDKLTKELDELGIKYKFTGDDNEEMHIVEGVD